VASNNITFIPNFTRISPVTNHMKHTDMTRPTCISSMCCVKTLLLLLLLFEVRHPCCVDQNTIR